MSGFFYLAASVLFILALRGLSSPETSRKGNIFGVVGMVIAIITTLADPGVVSFTMILLGMLIGGAIGTFVAIRIQIGETLVLPYSCQKWNFYGPRKK